MLMALPDVADTYRLTLVQNFVGQEVINVFYYRDEALLALDPTNVARGFWERIKTDWRALMKTNPTVTAEEVRCQALFSPYAFGSYSIPAGEKQGTRSIAGEFAPPILAGLITLKVATRVTRPGSKRIMGMTEDDFSLENLTAGYTLLLQNLADELDQVITEFGSANDLTPVIVHYPGQRDPTVQVQDVVDAVASSFLSHQVSRDSRP
jgi:hypothetical protein